MKLCEETYCTGCLACYNACRHDAIKLVERKGFIYPVINPVKCTECGLCSKACPELAMNDYKVKPKDNISYAVINKDKRQRDTSSSGGVFITLASKIINNGGSVFGAAFQTDLSVRHIRIDRLEDICKLQGSKYTQSDIHYTYREVENDLKKGIPVLFSSVSCQIAGLRKYLRKEYDNLYTAEILCHGGGSPIAYKNHLQYMGKCNDSKVVAVNFRYKDARRCQNLLYAFENGKKYLLNNPIDDLYYSGFLGGLLLRNSCFKCSHVGIERCGDLLLGDFWGVDKSKINYPDEMSYASLILVYTDKGQALFEECKASWNVVDRPLIEAIRGNLCLRRHIPKSKWNQRFFEEQEEYGYEQAAKHCLVPHFNIKSVIKDFIGPKATKIMLKVLGR
jgi:coenzyme F420-reducing hydrogenase beta subunit